MRSLLLTGDAVGGVWRYSLELAAGLLARGIGASLAVLGPPPSAAQAEQARAAGVQLFRTGLPLDWTAPDADTLRGTAAELAGLAHRLRVDRVHLHTPALAAHAPWSVPVVAIAHSDVGTWWQAARGGRLGAEFTSLVEATAHGLAEADAVIAPSHAHAEALARLYRPGRRIDVVHNGLAAGAGLPALTPTPRARAVLAAGRVWDDGKNFALLQAVATGLDAPVTVAGPLEGPNGAAVALECVHCPGTLAPDALAAEMARCGVFISPSRYEPFGLAVLEAARAGMALALSDIPTHRELWDGAALFFHPEDAGAARDALRRLLDAPAAFASRAARRAERYTLEAMVERTLAIHRGLSLRRVA